MRRSRRTEVAAVQAIGGLAVLLTALAACKNSELKRDKSPGAAPVQASASGQLPRDPVPAGSMNVASLTLDGGSFKQLKLDLKLTGSNSSLEWYPNRSPKQFTAFNYAGGGASVIFSVEAKKGKLSGAPNKLSLYLPKQSPAVDHELGNLTLEVVGMNVAKGYLRLKFSGQLTISGKTDQVTGDVTIVRTPKPQP